MEIVWLIIVGAIVGFLGRLLAGRDVNWIATILIGIIGTFLGFYIWSGLGGESTLVGYLIGVVVAALLVVLFSRMTARGSGTRV